jgi:hypothetical protein
MAGFELEVRNSGHASIDYLGLLVREVGVGNIVEELYPLEWMAQDAAASLWASWVLFRVHPSSGSTDEVSYGGLGFAHDAIRRYVRQTRQICNSFADSSDGSPSSGATAADVAAGAAAAAAGAEVPAADGAADARRRVRAL